MWRTLFLVVILASLPSAISAGALAWQICGGAIGPVGPVLRDCRPMTGVIDPQGRELWLRATVPAPADAQPHALYVGGVASSRAWLNGQRLGENGRPAGSAAAERPGRYEVAFPIRESQWAPGANELVVQMSSFHGGLRIDRPIGALMIARYPYPSRVPLLAVTWLAAGALLAAAFGFGMIHLTGRTRSSLTLAALAGIAALQAVVESLRSVWPYAYPLHAWRLVAIWLLAASFAVLLVSFVSGRFLPRAHRLMTGLALVTVAGTWLFPGFDNRTGWSLVAGVVLSSVCAMAGVRRRRPGARLILAYLALFFVLGFGFPEWLGDLSYFLLAAGLLLPLLMVEVVRLGRGEKAREAALTHAVSRPNRLTVASARGVELVPIPDIVAVVGADDYAELRLIGGRSLLHAERLDRLQEQLPPQFLRVHRSAIVNLVQVESLERREHGWRVHMCGNMVLSVSRSRLTALREALNDARPASHS